MAVKDPALDQAIIDAARTEFMAHGFRSASLHKIADRAGITTGALYTRYRNKDALFRSLVSPALLEIRQQMGPIGERYAQAQALCSRQALMEAIRREEQIYLDLLFDHYQDCVLFFCKSEGSSLERELQTMTDWKARETAEFFRSIARSPLDFDGIRLIAANQLYCYKQILSSGCTKEKARSCLETLDLFLEAGWKAIFDRVLGTDPEA